MKKKLMNIISLGIVLCLSFNIMGCVNPDSNSPVIPKSQARDVGDWSLEVVANSDVFGITDEVNIQELLRRDDVRMVLIDFWASWSSPATKSISYLEQIYQQHKHKGLVLLLINLDIKNDKFYQRIIKDIEEFGLTCPVLWDYNSEVKQALDIGGIPSVLLVDKEGKIRYERTGSTSREIDMPPLMNAIEFLLNESR